MRSPGEVRIRGPLIGLVGAALAASLMVACEAPPATGTPAVVRLDSAGIEVVHNTGVENRWLELTEVLRIGVLEGEEAYMFAGISDLDRHPDGRLLVADGSQLKIFDPEGRFLRQMGGRGEGPGEFMALFSAWWGGEYVLGHDVFESTVARFDTLGVLASDQRIEGAPRTSPEQIVDFNGRALGIGTRYGAGTPEGRRAVHIAEIVEVDLSTGEVSEVLARFPAGTGMMTEYGESSSPAFDSIARPALVGEDRLLVSSGMEYVVDLVAFDSTLIRRVTRDFDPVPLGADAQDYYERAMRFRYGDRMSATEMAGVLRRGPDLDRIPPVGMVVASADGGFWVYRPDLFERPLEAAIGPISDTSTPEAPPFDLFDATGAYLGSVRFDPGFRPLWFGSDLVVGVDQDELGVQRVVAYRIESSDPAP